MVAIFLTHDAEFRANYYGARALAGLRELGEVRLNESGAPLATDALIAAAAGCQIIVSDRATPGEAALFDAAPDLVAFLRCAVDIRTVDLPAASRNGVLVTNASPGFVDAATELVFGLMIDLARGGIGVLCLCNRCGHRAEAATTVLVSQLGPDFPVPEIGTRMRCGSCGSKDVATRPAWSGDRVERRAAAG